MSEDKKPEVNNLEDLSHELLNAACNIEGAFKVIERQMDRMRNALKEFKDNLLNKNGIKEV